jgi:hypothetical protein
MFIEHLIDTGNRILLFTRPRRMGKTLNLTMLRYFFECKEDNRALFKGLYIENSPAFTEANKYPVIYLDFKSLQPDNYKLMFFKNLQDQLSKYVDEDHYSKSVKFDIEQSSVMISAFLKDIMANIYEVHGVRTVLLIDEYDKLLMDHVNMPVFDELRTFVKSVMLNALKGNEFLERAVITGVNRIAQESMFSDLNNIAIHDVFKKSVFDTDFGFTEEEICGFVPVELLDKTRLWYNNYRVGNATVYFTFSVMSMLSYGKFANYWGMSGTISSIRKSMTSDRFKTLTDIVDGFGETSVGMNLKHRLTVDDILRYQDDDAFYSLLVQTGYLTYSVLDEGLEYLVSLPNLELQQVWRAFILKQVTGHPVSLIQRMVYDIDKNDHFEEDFAGILTTNSLSYFDFDVREPEKTYHVMVFGLLVGGGIRCRSNCESGGGRYDLLAVLCDKNILFEFKKAVSVDTMVEAARAALVQIRDRHYADAITNGLPTFTVGIGFYKKQCEIVVER